LEIAILETAARKIEDVPVEVVERKGKGHPDTLADRFAEKFVTEYVAWSRKAIGEQVNHWVDKCVLIGGESRNEFGASHMISPIRAMVIGKATRQVGDLTIPLADIATTAAHSTLRAGLVGFTAGDCQVEICTNDYTGSGRPSSWYRPAAAPGPSPAGRSNDTVVCTAYAPHSATERLVIGVESYLTSGAYRESRPATGTDVKVLAIRRERTVSLVLCVPALPGQVASRADYDAFRDGIVSDVAGFVRNFGGPDLGDVRLNTRDSADAVYMAHLGSAIATGDVGAVGRGNRINGVIAPGRPTHLEAPAGKNPIYHGGKVALVLAQCVADQVNALLGAEVQVSVVAENGQPLSTPTLVAVELTSACSERDRRAIDATVRAQLAQVEALTEKLATEGLDAFSSAPAFQVPR
jgi:S-adenosylmethionine synthetase